MAIIVHLPLFISRLMAPIAAKQGAQIRLKTMKEKPASGVKACCRSPQISVPSSLSSPPKWNRMPKVPTTFSLAIRPVTVAATALQLPQPSGAKIHLTAPPKAASNEKSISSSPSIWNLPSMKPK